MKADRLEKLREALKKPEPARTTGDIYEYITDHRDLVVRDYGSFIKLFEDYFDDLNIAIGFLNFVPKDKWPKHRGVQYHFFPETMKTLHRAFEDALDGYYHESITLLRSVFETYLRMVFLSCHSADWESVFYELKGRRKFDVTAFMRDDLKIDWKFLYTIMCKVSHSKVHYHLGQLIDWSKGAKQPAIQLEYRADKTMLGMCINLILLNLALLFHMMMVLFEPDFKNHPELAKRRKRFVQEDKSLRNLIRDNPKPKFAQICSDLLKIRRIIRSSDSGKNWKAIA